MPGQPSDRIQMPVLHKAVTVIGNLMATIKTILTLLLISVWLTSCGQIISQKQLTVKLNKIDSLQTDKEVFTFVKQKFPKFNVDGTFDNYPNETQQIADSLKIKNWVKADIDNNGETDLLIFRAYNLPKIFAILSKGEKFTAISAEYFCKYQFMYPVVTSVNNQNIVLLFNQDQIDYDANIKQFIYTKLTCDTLIVKDNLFVNYVQYSKQEQIEQIELFNDGMCEGNCPRINIAINAKTFENKCFKEMYWDNKPKPSTGQLSHKEIEKILSLLDYSNFTGLKEKYEVGCTDQPTTTLKITYDNGKIKIIQDYGSAGNFTLTEIYKIAYGIKWTEKKGSR